MSVKFQSAIADSLTTDGLDLETVLELSRRRDPVGVVTIYLDARPGDGLRAASIDITNRLNELERRLASQGSPERAHAIRDGIAWLAPELERLLDPEEPGRGRILFAAMSGGWRTRISSQLRVPNRVVLDRSAFIHPLIELLDEGAPVGVVLASRTEARLLEWRFGELTELRELRADAVEPPHERSGPVGSRPTNRYGTPTGEQRRARERDQAARFIERVAAAASSLADEHRWKRVLISGGEQLTAALIRGLPAALREAVVIRGRWCRWSSTSSMRS